ncbi:hypothetical protein KCU67_g7488, partial [Aureobasidium melanogenum]
MKKRQKKSKGPIVPPSRPVDFTAPSGNGLGDLGRFPREIRNMIYSSLVPQVMPHAFEHKIIDRFAVRKLVNAPILATSKQLCVEFLEVFIREVHLEEDDDNNEDPTPEDDDLDEGSRYKPERPPNCLERLLAFVEARIDFAFSTKRVGIVINTVYLCSDMMKHIEETGEGDVHRLPQPLRRLWDIHEKYGIPSDQIYIKIDYWEPSWYLRCGANYRTRSTSLPRNFWDHEFEHISAVVTLSNEEASIRAYGDMKKKLRDQLTAYKAIKLHQFRDICSSKKEHVTMDETLNETLYHFYYERPCPAMFEFHIDMGKTAIGMWKAKEEQYSVWHLFDLAESWLEVKNE